MFQIPVIRPFGVDIFCLGKKYLIFNMVMRNLKIKYRRSVLGVFWTLLSPISMTLVYYFVFKVVLKIQIPHYLAFILSGVLPWTFLSQTLAEGMESIVGNVGLLSKVPIQPQVLPYVNALTNLSTLVLSVPILISTAWMTEVPLGLSLICLPFFFLSLFLLTYSLSLVLGLMFVFFRDLRHVITILLQLWFYGTPVFYDEGMVPQQFEWILNLNPVARIFTGIHKIMAHGTWPTAKEICTVSAWVLCFFVLSCLFQKRFSNELVESL